MMLKSVSLKRPEPHFLPVNCNGQKMKNGGRATEDVTRGPHITEVVTESPLHADLKGEQNDEEILFCLELFPTECVRDLD